MKNKYPPRLKVGKDALTRNVSGFSALKIDVEENFEEEKVIYISKEEFDAIVQPLVEALEEGYSLLSSALYELNCARITIRQMNAYSDALTSLDNESANLSMQRYKNAMKVLENYKKQIEKI